jgi:hypothetical protein
MEPVLPGLTKKPLPPFLSKMLAREETEKFNERQIKKFDFIPLFQSLHREYKIDFDMNMAKYFKALIVSNGCEIYDEDCFVANMPPIDRKKLHNREYLHEQIINHSALNLTL